VEINKKKILNWVSLGKRHPFKRIQGRSIGGCVKFEVGQKMELLRDNKWVRGAEYGKGKL